MELPLAEVKMAIKTRETCSTCTQCHNFTFKIVCLDATTSLWVSECTSVTSKKASGMDKPKVSTKEIGAGAFGHSEEETLALPEFQWWYKALQGDVDKVANTLYMASSREIKNRLVNGRFHRTQPETCRIPRREPREKTRGRFEATTPLTVALAFSAPPEMFSVRMKFEMSSVVF